MADLPYSKSQQNISIVDRTTGSAAAVNANNQLEVNANLNPVLSSNVMYKDILLANAGSVEMNVNGSGTNVNFDFTPATGSTFYLETLGIIIIDNGLMTNTNFGAITGSLNQGIQLLIRSQGTEYEETIIKDNTDLLLTFTGGVGGGMPGATGFMNTDDFFNGKMTFERPIKLDGNQGDYIRIKVRDNLATLDMFRSIAHIWRII